MGAFFPSWHCRWTFCYIFEVTGSRHVLRLATSAPLSCNMRTFTQARNNSLPWNDTTGSPIALENACKRACMRPPLQLLHVFLCLSNNPCQLITVWWRAVRLVVAPFLPAGSRAHDSVLTCAAIERINSKDSLEQSPESQFQLKKPSQRRFTHISWQAMKCLCWCICRNWSI